MTFYPVIDRLTKEDCSKVGVDYNLIIRSFFGTYTIYGDKDKKIQTVFNGEVRPPKQGEWYLSTNAVYAFRARNDLEQSYRIARLVLTQDTTTTKIISGACRHPVV